MLLRPLLLVMFAACIAAAAGQDGPRPVSVEREQEARHQLDGIERELAEARELGPAERRAREQRCERSLERAVDKAANTRHANKACYLLAAWRMSYADGKGVPELLDRIDGSGYPAYQQAAKQLRVRWLLRKGRPAEARALATGLVATIPEFAPLLDLCAFHEQVGIAAPRTAGEPLAGGPADPGARPEPWLVYHFTRGFADDDGWLVQQWLDELGRPEYAGKARLVCVVAAANPLAAIADLRALPGADAVDLLWANPAPDGEAARWQAAWKLPDLPATVLLGPQRTIVAVQPVPADLRVLVGGDRPAPAAPSNRSGRPGWSK